MRSGTVCIDKYEASVWYVPPEEASLIGKIQDGKVELADLMKAGAVQLGLSAFGDLAAYGCPVTGNGCVNVYAVSIPGVVPAHAITWFQAAAAARNSLKRLPTNQEWQVAALGTPDGAPCNVSGSPWITGYPGCVSDVGAFDMVGNIGEWMADWADRPVTGVPCTPWPAEFGNDSCFGGPGGPGDGGLPGALMRTGFFVRVFLPSSGHNTVGFRCAR